MAIFSMLRNHRTYVKAMRLAAEYIQDPDEFNRVIKEGQEKLASSALKARDSVYEGLDIMLRMLSAYAKGEYRAIPWRTLLIVTAAVIYFVSPLDFLPDLLPAIGFADDVAIIVWTFGQIKHDVDQFLAWEQAQQKPQASLADHSAQEMPPPVS